MRRVRTRRSTTRIRRRPKRMLMPKSMVPETKYNTLIDVSKSIKNNFFGSTTATLKGVNNFYTDIISGISKGTDDNQRIGDRIYVKFMTIHLFIQGCTEATGYDNVLNFLIRVFVHNSRLAAGTDITNFFRGVSISPITHLKPDRRNSTVWFDKYYPMITASGVLASSKGAGPIRIVKIKLPIYRNVNFDSSGLTKDDNSLYSLSVAGYNMAGAADTAKQVACMDVCIRTYFTDS